MKPSLLATHLFIVMLLSSTLSLYAQTVEERVKVIRQMYAEVINLQKSSSSSACKKGSLGNMSNINPDGRDRYLRATQCFYSGGYSKVICKVVRWEYEINSEYFFKNGKLFFISSVADDVCGTTEYRFYFDTNGRAIRILEKPNDCNTEGVKENREVYNSQRRTELLTDANNHLRDALSIVK